jgi:hypothetical protein
MTDDVEETLASLEQRLRALQAEIDAAEEPAPEPRRFAPREEPRRPARHAPSAAPAPTHRSAPPTEPLERFGAELRRLVDAWDRTVAEMRGGDVESAVFRGGVALEARADLAGLCALDRALRGVAAVRAVTLRAYAGGAAALEVALDSEVALVAELRRSLAFDVVEIRGGRLSIALS